MKHRPELDGLRGIAILIVLAAHAHAPGFGGGGGGAGVTLFFGLSGYLITSLLLAEHSRAGRVDLRAFYIRRALRLFPALWAVLLGVLVLVLAGLMPQDKALLGTDYRVVFLGVLAYVGNWVFVAGSSLGVLGHTWSLAVEEQFYLVWPALLLIGLRVGQRRFATWVLVVAMLVTPWRLILASAGAVDQVLVGTDSHADALLMGGVVALLGIRVPQIGGWIGMAGLCGLAWIWPAPAGAGVVFLPVAAVLSTISVAGCPRLLAWGPLAFIGKISYGIYLYHGVIIWWGLAWPVTIVVSIGISWVSYVLLESRFLKLKGRLRQAQPLAPSLSPQLASTEPRAG
jgi:peptidoglycan/LPS O-acetylase OafA/YrhL